MSKMMKAAYIEKTGPSENIKFGDLPVPQITDNQVLVKVKAVALNHIDTYIRAGQTQQTLTFPYILGHDFCGVVEAVGKNVTQFKPGQRVWSCNMGANGRQGCFSEYVAIDENLLYSLPNNVDDVEAVSALQGGATACIGLIRTGKLMPNETIFINGGAGNIGSAIIQLAKERGANIIATVGSPEKAEWCKKLGANRTINYKTEKVDAALASAAPNGIDIYWDTTREPNLEMAIPLLAKRGRVIMMAGHSAHPTVPVGPLYRKDCSLLGFSIFNASSDDLTSAAAMINLCLQLGKLKTKVAQVMPLSDTAKAHKMLETDKALWGKLVLTT